MSNAQINRAPRFTITEFAEALRTGQSEIEEELSDHEEDGIAVLDDVHGTERHTLEEWHDLYDLVMNAAMV